MEKYYTLIFTILILLVLASSISFAAEIFEVSENKKITKDNKVSVIVELEDSSSGFDKFKTLSFKKLNIKNKETKEDKIKKSQDRFLKSLNKNTFSTAKTSGATNKIRDVKKYKTVNALSMEVSKSELELLKTNPNVKRIFYNQVLHTILADSVPLIQANEVWGNSISGINITGSGFTACVLDTGVDTDHEAFVNKIVAQNCFCNMSGGCCPNELSEDTNAEDDAVNSHGSHVSGIVLSNGTTKGVASGASLVSVKVCNSAGSCLLNDIISGVDYCNSIAQTYNIKAISISIGDGAQYNTQGACPRNLLDDLIDVSYFKNITVAIATGNNYFTAGISYPACSPNATAVGSSTKTDALASYGNRGALLKLLAPGSSITSSVKTGGYSSLDGTSMATPHVSGAVLLIQHYLSLSGKAYMKSDALKDLFFDTGKTISSWKRIDVFAALLSLQSNLSLDQDLNLLSNNNISSVQFTDNTTFTNANDCISLTANRIFVNSSLCSEFNKTAIITFYNISNAKIPAILKDGVVCNAPDCNIESFSSNTLVFNVSSFSSYTSGPNSNLTIYDSFENLKASPIDQILFSANFSNLSSGKIIPSANCTIRFNTSTWSNFSTMPYNSTNKLFQFNKTIPDLGVHNWQVSCNHSLFETLNTTDTINITNSRLLLGDSSDSATIHITQQINLYANFSNSSLNTPINAGNSTCQIQFNTTSWSTYTNMTFNASEGLHKYNRTFNSSDINLWRTFCFSAIFDNKTATRTISFPPTVNLINPANNSVWTNSNFVTFSYNVSDNLSAIQNCSLYTNNVLTSTDTSIIKDINQTINTTLVDADYNWSIKCFDIYGNLGNSTVFNLTVFANNSAPTILANASVNWVEDSSKTLNMSNYFNDTNSDPLTYTFSSLTSISKNATGEILILTPDYNYNGAQALTIIASDYMSNTSLNLSLNISGVNDPPNYTTTIPAQSWAQGATNYDAFDLDDYFSDVDSGTLTYTAAGTSSISVNIDGSNNADFSQASTFSGSETVVFTADDGANSTSSGSISLTVTASSPSGGSSGGSSTASTCSDECTAGNATCSSNTTLKTCGDYDIDNCLEFRSTTCSFACDVGRCVSCIEAWDCSEWNDCSFGGTQVRTCTEITTCGTDYAKPAELQSCTAQELPGTTILETQSGTGELADDLNTNSLDADNTADANKTKTNSTIICGDDRCSFSEMCWSDCKGSYTKAALLIILITMLSSLLYYKKQKQIGFQFKKTKEPEILTVEDMFKRKTKKQKKFKKI